MTDRPCLIDAPHPPHTWAPLVADPEHARVLHVGLATLHCPGMGFSEPPVETRYCAGCGEQYNAFEESHAGHEARRDG
jgi:hypothetical protein